MDDARARRLEVGRIGRAHGLRGEVLVSFVSDRPERTAPGATLYAVRPDADDRTLVVESSRPHQGRWLMQFEGVSDRTAAETLRGYTVHADELVTEGDELWVHELVGAQVVDRAGSDLGRITAVQANPAHDLLVLDGGALVPVTFVVAQTRGRVVVDVPEGLFDL